MVICHSSWLRSVHLAGIANGASSRGRRATLRGLVAAKNIHVTTQAKPANATHWSTRNVARHLRISDLMA